MSRRKCEAAFPVSSNNEDCPARYFECTRREKHRVHEARWVIYASGGHHAELVLRWREDQ